MKKVLTFLMLMVLSVFAHAQNIETYIHPRAEPLLPVIKEEAGKYTPGLKSPWVMAAIFDHETCPGYKSYKCWNTSAQLKTSREQGLGLPQMTRTWNPDGSIRFDNMANLKRNYPSSLGELDWETFSSKPRLQIRSGLILFNEGYRQFAAVTNENERLRMARSAYNGGGGRVATARSRCKLTTSCDPQIWFMNVEKHLPQSRTPMKGYGNRSPYEINTHYVKDTERRLAKFKPYFED